MVGLALYHLFISSMAKIFVTLAILFAMPSISALRLQEDLADIVDDIREQGFHGKFIAASTALSVGEYGGEKHVDLTSRSSGSYHHGKNVLGPVTVAREQEIEQNRQYLIDKSQFELKPRTISPSTPEKRALQEALKMPNELTPFLQGILWGGPAPPYESNLPGLMNHKYVLIGRGDLEDQFCIGWEQITKQPAPINQKWWALRRLMTKMSWTLAWFAWQDSVGSIQVNCLGGTKLDSDMDCAVQAADPALIIQTTLKILSAMLGDLCPTVASVRNHFELGEYLFDFNLYGDLTIVDSLLFHSFANGVWHQQATRMFQEGRKTKDGKDESVMALLNVCHPSVMRDAVHERLNTWCRISSAVSAADKQAALQQFWNKFQDASSSIWSSGDVPGALFEELQAVAKTQTECYWTYAALYDVVILNQGKVADLVISSSQQECVNEISSYEQLAFVLHHVLHDLLSGEITEKDPLPPLMKFLFGSAKYINRMRFEWLKSESGQCRSAQARNLLLAAGVLYKGKDVVKEAMKLIVKHVGLERGVPTKIDQYVLALCECLGYEGIGNYYQLDELFQLRPVEVFQNEFLQKLMENTGFQSILAETGAASCVVPSSAESPSRKSDRIDTAFEGTSASVVGEFQGLADIF